MKMIFFNRALQKQGPVFDTAVIPAITYLISFIAGYFAFNFIASMASAVVFAILIAIGIFPKIRLLKLINIIFIALLFICGYLYAYFNFSYVTEKYTSISEKDVTANFKVISEIEYKDKLVKFDGEFLDTEYNGEKCALTVGGTDGYDIEINDVVRIEHLDIEGVVPYSIPEQILNISNRVSDGIFIYGSSTSSAPQKISDGNFSVVSFFNNIKENIRSVLDKFLKKNQYDLISGILTGYRDYTNEYLNNILVSSGISHIVVVSGLHFSVLIFILLYILRSFLLNPKLSAFITIIFSIFIAFFFGITPSVMRALIMTDILLLADILNRDKSSNFHYLISTAVIMILINPFIIYDVGFILSFTSVAGIFIFNNNIYDKTGYIHNKIRGIISVALASNILTIPICAFYFNTLSLAFVAGNLLITPIITLLMLYSVIAVLIGAVSNIAGVIVFAPLNFILGILLIPLDFLSQISFLNYHVISPSVSAVLIYYTGVTVFSSNSKYVKTKYISALVLISYFALCLFVPENSILVNNTDLYVLGNELSGKVMINNKSRTVVCDLSNSEDIYNLKTVIDKKALSEVDVYVVGSIPALEGLSKISKTVKINEVIYPESFNNYIFLSEKLNNINAHLTDKTEYNRNIGNISLTINYDNNYNINSVEINCSKDKVLVSKDMINTYDNSIYNVFSKDKLSYYMYNKITVDNSVINRGKELLYREIIK